MLVERPAARQGPLDLLIVQAPGNRHDLGVRIAEHLLVESGLSVEAITQELPLDDVEVLLRDRQPSWLGISCALPGMVEDARAFAAELVTRGYRGGVMLAGQAVRRSSDASQDVGFAICPTIEDARTLIVTSRASTSRLGITSDPP